MRCFKQQPVLIKYSLPTVFSLIAFLLSIGPVCAMDFNLGPDTTLDVDVQLRYSAAWRLEDPDPELANNKGLPSYSIGDQAFDKGDMITNKVSTTIDIDLNHKNMGLFVRPRAYFDFVYDDDDKFSEEVQDLHRDKVEILDAFAYADFELGNLPMAVRLGRQVVSWGESLFIPFGISTAMNQIDFSSANTPGTELKDIFLPTNQVFVKLGLPAGFSLSGYYKFEWERSRLNEAGSYFQNIDLVLDAGIDVPIFQDVTGDGVPDHLGTINQISPDEASDDGQYGVALRYFSEALNGTEFGFYYLNYHDHIPLATTRPTGGRDDGGLVPPIDAWSYQATYQEDIKLIGFSISAELFGWNIAPEISYRTDYPIRIKSDPVNEPWHFLGFKYAEGDMLQAQCSFLKLFPGTFLWEGLTVLGEVAYMQYSNFDGEILELDDQHSTEEAWQYVVQVSPNWTNVLLNGLDLDMPITWNGAPSGIGNQLGGVIEKQENLGVKFNFTYNQKYQLGLGYVTYIGDPYDNAFSDRDYYSIDLKCTF